MKNQIKIFGAALDPLNSPERLNLKLGYLAYLGKEPEAQKKSDPYDLIREYLSKEPLFIDRKAWFGKMEIESWLTPKPNLADLHFLTPEQFTNFLYKNKCLDYALRKQG